MPIGQPDLPATDEGSAASLPYPERLIREAMESGEFDDLPGTGRPIPGRGTRDDELWWVREWMRRNSVGQEPSNSE